MYKFAHVSDIHLGFQEKKALQEIEQEVFEEIVDSCIKKKVDFILITGDLFHRNLPEMRVQRYAFRNFKKLYDAKIPIYAVYGSHDFSPIEFSVIDLLTDIGYLTKVSKEEIKNGKTLLEFTKDPKTKVKLAGISGRTAGVDKENFENLEVPKLDNSFKIFLFHIGIEEINSNFEIDSNSISVKSLPKEFNYYAGGHVHVFIHKYVDDVGRICYPGTPFAGHHNDLEENAKHTKRGFVIVEFDDEVKNVEFIEVKKADYELIEFNADGKTANALNIEILKNISKIEADKKIILLKIRGELKSGKTSEVNFTEFKKRLFQQGAIEINVNRTHLSSKKYHIEKIIVEKKEDIENKIFEENIKNIKTEQSELEGKKGIKFAKELLQVLKEPIISNEKKVDYQKRISLEVLSMMEIND